MSSRKNMEDFLRYVIANKNYIEYELDISNVAANRAFATPDGVAGNASYRALVANDIPNLDAAKFTSGTFDAAEIPNLDASKFNAGTFDTAEIPNLPASQFTTGSFNAARIPNLDASKIGAGQFTTGFTLSNFASPAAIGNTTPNTGTMDDLYFDTALGAVQVNSGLGAEVVTNGVTIAYFSATETSIQLPAATNYFTAFTSSTGMAGMLCVKVRSGGISPLIIPFSGDDIDGASSLATASNRGLIFFAVLATRWRVFARI